MEKYDVIVIGGGPAGCAAALYCGRGALNTLMVEKLTPGGQMGTTDEIENYPGFPTGINGAELAFAMLEQAERFGTVTQYKEVSAIAQEGPLRIVRFADGSQAAAGAVILATGAAPRVLGVPGEDQYRGRGVSYCATCDGAFYRGKTVAVVGGGDTAAADALFLSKICQRVYLIHRRDSLRAAKIYHSRLEKAKNVEFLWDSALESVTGEEKVTGIAVKNLKTLKTDTLEVQGVFIAVGTTPATGFLRGTLELDDRGYVPAGEDTRTAIPGVFVAGDTRAKALRQVVTAVADGAVAAHLAGEYLDGLDKIGAE